MMDNDNIAPDPTCTEGEVKAEQDEGAATKEDDMSEHERQKRTRAP